MIGTTLYIGPGLKLDALHKLANEGDVAALATLDMLGDMAKAGWIEPLPEATSDGVHPKETAVDLVEQEIRRQATELVRSRIRPAMSGGEAMVF